MSVIKNSKMFFLALLAAAFCFISSCALFEITSGQDTAAEEAVLDTNNLPEVENSGYQPVSSTAAEEEIFADDDTGMNEAQQEIESADIEGASEEGIEKIDSQPTPSAVAAPKELEEEQGEPIQ